jgi:hypothetical protein
MLKLDNSLLDELGLGALPEVQKRAMLQHIYDTLELRVGTNLANQMTDRQLEEFEKFIDDGGDANQAQALQWLEANLPNYKQVVNEVFEALKAEIKQMAPQIMAASMPQQPQPVQPQPQSLQQQAPGLQPQAVAPPVDRQQMPQPPPVAPTQSAQPPYASAYPQTQATNSYPVQPNQGQDARVYQFPTQQPPAGPGIRQSSPPPGDQQAA